MNLTEKHYLRPAEVCKLLGISRSTLSNYEKRPGFPAKIRLSRRNVQYRTADLLKWINTDGGQK